MHQMSEYDFQKTLQKTGNSVTDFYYGCLDVNVICSEIKTRLNELNAFQETAYQKWITRQDLYFTFRLHDGSDWLMRSGEDKKRYIHIHPGKHSKHSKRIKSRSLRIVLAMDYYSQHKNELYSLDFLNYIRQEKLNLPPVKGFSDVYYWLINQFDHE